MGDGFSFDASEIDRLAADLGDVAAGTGKRIRQAVEVTSRNVRDGWRDRAKGLSHAPAFPYSISYDLAGGEAIRGSQIAAEIGPDKSRRQGALGNLLEYGSVNNAPMGLGHAALQTNEADFVKGLNIALGLLEKEHGL